MADDQQQFFADLASIGHIDLLRKGNDRLPTHPPHGVRVPVPSHRSNLGVCEESQEPQSPAGSRQPPVCRPLLRTARRQTGAVP